MNHPTSDRAQWIATAHRLRTVRKACLEFVDKWMTRQLCADLNRVDRIAGAVDACAEIALADPRNHDWSLLYRGSVLDD